MKLSEFKNIVSQNNDLNLEGGFTVSLYLFFYASSFLLELLNNYFNKNFYNRLPDDEKENFYVKIIRRIIDNTFPAVIFLHNVEFLSNIVLLMKKLVDWFYDLTAGSSFYLQRFVRKVLSPTYLLTKGITKTAQVYAYIRKNFSRIYANTKKVIEEISKDKKVLLQIEKEQENDKEFQKAVKETVKEIKNN